LVGGADEEIGGLILKIVYTEREKWHGRGVDSMENLLAFGWDFNIVCGDYLVVLFKFC
jgi:hypothetical protein